MKRINILVAEDDANIREGLLDTLESEGYRCTAAADGNQAVSLFKQGGIDLVLLDIMMPGKSGYDVCRDIRSRDRKVPIVMLTAKGEEVDKVVGLQLGADDYVTKPFGIHELVARVGAALRRARVSNECSTPGENSAKKPFRFGVAEIDPARFEARRGRKTYSLSPREMKLLHAFHERPGEVLGRDELLNLAWGIEYYGTTRTLDQHVAQLRKKVEKNPSSPIHIITVHGVGYRYER